MPFGGTSDVVLADSLDRVSISAGVFLALRKPISLLFITT